MSLGARSLIPGAKKKQQEQQAEMTFRFNAAMADYQQREQDRLSKLATYRAQIDQWNANAAKKAQLQNDEIEAFRLEFESGDPDAIVSYFDLVLSRSSYPEGFPTNHRIAFVPESKQLVVECELPGVNAIPDVKAHRYVKTKDEVTSTPRAVAQIRSLYSSAISQITIRKLHELFEADLHGFIETIVLNGYVDTVDPRTGQQAKPMLVTIRTTRAIFEGIDLRRVDPIACLQHLGASVSKSPAELSPVRPVLEFDMVDKRFVEEGDILSALDQRPNLMELTPSEFETLITNLFTKMGLEARLTQASRDGGVDCVAFDPRPVFGGKVVIQAKRYKGTVGVSAVRDLFGTVHNEGASKGILVTTSGYGAASHQFANGKPLELIDGAGLLYLLSEHAGIEAKIVPPDEWVEPALAP
jgi:restriction system protein